MKKKWCERCGWSVEIVEEKETDSEVETTSKGRNGLRIQNTPTKPYKTSNIPDSWSFTTLLRFRPENCLDGRPFLTSLWDLHTAPQNPQRHTKTVSSFIFFWRLGCPRLSKTIWILQTFWTFCGMHRKILLHPPQKVSAHLLHSSPQPAEFDKVVEIWSRTLSPVASAKGMAHRFRNPSGLWPAGVTLPLAKPLSG